MASDPLNHTPGGRLLVLLLLSIAYGTAVPGSSAPEIGVTVGRSGGMEHGKKEMKCLKEEREALLKFNHSLNGAFFSWTGDDCCSWKGVSCSSETGHVTHLDLSFQIKISDSGKIDASLLQLKRLAHLNLAMNSFGGSPIPEFFGSFPELKYLDLSRCHFTGGIPPQLGNLSSLLRLDLSTNQLTGNLHGFMRRLTSGSRSAALAELNLADNGISGTIPLCLGQLTNLTTFWVPRNLLEGAISETHFANLSRLRSLGLSHNRLVFDVTQHWIPPPRLTSVWLGSCNIGPPFPTWLRFLPDYSMLDLSNNHISDNIPLWFWNLSRHYSYLNLSQNQMQGQIPPSFGSDSSGVIIDLSSNSFFGPLLMSIPDAFVFNFSDNLFTGMISMNITNVDFLSLSNNQFHGKVPSSFCNSSALGVLDCSRNSLSGHIPQCLGRKKSMMVLDLSYNYLTGTIPNFFNLSDLQWLQLSHNRLSGFLPNSIEMLPPPLSPYVKSQIGLDLSENKFSGNIPEWIGEHLSNLIILNLRSNMFIGIIPPQLSLLSSLKILDLSDNKLIGSIPSTFFNFSSMKKSQNEYISDWLGPTFFMYEMLEPTLQHQIHYENSVEVIVKRTTMRYTKNLAFVHTLDLSGNCLSGEIPQTLTSLIGLMNLNLSQNRLEGKIPKDIGKMQELESLDLSKNLLSGTIPISIAMLTFLSTLNLSNNNLSGRIPSGTQLQTLNDPSIYFGNVDLCGEPLPKLCYGEDAASKPSKSLNIDDDENDNSRFIWFGFGAMPGFVIGFWSFCGTMVFKKSWRIAYYKCTDTCKE